MIPVIVRLSIHFRTTNNLPELITLQKKILMPSAPAHGLRLRFHKEGELMEMHVLIHEKAFIDWSTREQAYIVFIPNAGLYIAGSWGEDGLGSYGFTRYEDPMKDWVRPDMRPKAVEVDEGKPYTPPEKKPVAHSHFDTVLHSRACIENLDSHGCTCEEENP